MASELLQNYSNAFGTTWQGMKSLGHADPQGFSQLFQGGGQIILAGWDTIRARAQREQDEDYWTIKNILMTSASLLAVGVSIAAGMAVVAGLSTIAPPLLFASSCAGVVNASVDYFKDYTLSKKLNKELVTEEEIFEKIKNSSGLSIDVQNNILDNYIQKPRMVYDQLYALRKEILMDESISTENKNKALIQINNAIESFHRGETKPLVLDLDDAHKLRTEKINEDIIACGVAKERFNKLVSEEKLPRTLFLSIEKFKKTRENIHAQDLPQNAKVQINDLLDRKNFKKDDIKLAYAQMANQFLNQSAPQQVATKDKELLVYCRFKKPDLSDADHNTIEQYLKLPREILDTIDDIKQTLPESEQQSFINNVENTVKSYTHERIVNYIDDERISKHLDKYSKYNPEASNKLMTQLLGFRALHGTPAQYDENENLITPGIPGKINEILPLNTNNKKHNETNTLLQSALDKFQKESAVWHNRQKGVVIPSPNIDIREDKDENGIMSEVSSKIFSVFKRSKDETSKDAQENMDAQAFSKAVAKDMKKELKREKKELQNNFDAAYHNGTDALEKATQRNYLRKSKPRRLLNIGARLGVAIISGVSTVLLAAYVAPGIALGAVSSVLSAGAIINSVDLYRKKRKADEKVSGPNEQAEKGVSPDFIKAHKKSVKAQHKVDKKNEKENKKENKAQASLSSGYHTEWQPGKVTASERKQDKQPFLEKNKELDMEDVAPVSPERSNKRLQ